MRDLRAEALRVTVLLGLALIGAACPSGATETPPEDDGSSIGDPCTVDEECNGAICVGGVCTAANLDGGGNNASTSSSSGGGSSSSGGASDGGASDAASTDAYVPRAIIETDPNVGPIEFGAQRIGISVEKTVLVSNLGDAPMNIVLIGIRNANGGGPASEFTVEAVGGEPDEVPPNGQFTLRIRHRPTDGAPDHAFLSITTNAVNAPVKELELLAEFKGDATLLVHSALGDTGPDVASVEFGGVALGSTAEVHLYAKNNGAADSALTITSVAMDPPNSAYFSLSAGPLPRSISPFTGPCGTVGDCSPIATECTDGLCLVGGDGGPAYSLDVIDILVSFNAAQPGNASAELVISYDGAGSTLERRIPLSGIGQVGSLVADPDPLNFGQAFVGRTSTLPLTFTNEGNALITIDSMDWQFALPETDGGSNPPPAFRMELGSLTFPRNVTPQSDFSIDVVFQPTDLGGFNDFLQVHLSTGDVLRVHVTGRAVEEPTIDVQPLLDFGDRYVGTANVLDLEVRNLGPGDLSINRIFVQGNAASVFTFSPTQVTDAIPEDGSVTLQVTYGPQAVTLLDDIAELVLETNDPDAPQASVTLRGRAVRPIASVIPTPAFLDFGPVFANTTGQRQVRIKNEGVGDLVVDSDMIARSGGNLAPEFAITANKTLPAVVAAGGQDELIFTVDFTPLLTQTYNATFNITTSDPAVASLDVAMTGGGLTCTERPNATVTLENGECVYTCNSGYHACADTCLSDVSPDSCGTRCSPCDGRPAATAQCQAGECTYVCSDTSGHDLNNDLNVAQGVFSNGCEYACAVSPPRGETCNDLDDDCNGTADDGLPPDDVEPNTCSGSAFSTGNITDDNSWREFTGHKIYADGDSDWWKIQLREAETNFCWGDEDYQTIVELHDIQPGHDYDLKVYWQGCGDYWTTGQNGGTTPESLDLRWTGSCGSDDDVDLYVQVFSWSGASLQSSCYPYKLRVKHDRL
ncbi:MAG: choice-of-anchor D domain-containing protein [Myxococcota bacterium]